MFFLASSSSSLLSSLDLKEISFYFRERERAVVNLHFQFGSVSGRASSDSRHVYTEGRLISDRYESFRTSSDPSPPPPSSSSSIPSPLFSLSQSESKHQSCSRFLIFLFASPDAYLISALILLLLLLLLLLLYCVLLLPHGPISQRVFSRRCATLLS